MRKYDPDAIREKIERLLAAGVLSEPDPSAAAARALLEAARHEPPSRMRASVSDHLGHSILPSMRAYQHVGSVPPGTRLAFLKKILARVLRIVSAPQSQHNELTRSGLTVLAEGVDLVRQDALDRSEAMREALLQAAEALAALAEERDALRREVAEERERLRTELEAATNARIAEALAEAAREAREAATRMAERTAAELREALGTEDALLHRRIDDVTAAIWKGIGERDARLRDAEAGIAAAHEADTVVHRRISDETASLWKSVDAAAEDRAVIHQRVTDEVASLWKSVDAAAEDRATLHRRITDETASLWKSFGELRTEAERLHRRIGDELAPVWAELGQRGQRLEDQEVLIADIAQRLELLLQALQEFDSSLPTRLSAEEDNPMLAELRKKLARIPRLLTAFRELRQLVMDLDQSIKDNAAAIWRTIDARDKDIDKMSRDLQDLDKAIKDNTTDLWRGVAERDTQLRLLTESTQDLHRELSILESRIREAQARLLMIGEQLTEQGDRLERVEAGGPPTIPGMVAAMMTESTPAAPSAPGDPAARRALELAYLRFQREHRGDEVQLRRAQVRYVDLIREALAEEGGRNGHPPRLLDVACGDGIFLQLAREAGWEVQGVDLNAAMVKIGRERGLTIEQGDAIEFLEGSEPARFDAMTALQFIEHLEPEALMRLLRAARKALRPGGVLVIETLNPNTLKALHWYFLDLTHVRLVFPEMLRLLGETAGFRFERWEGINPAPAEQRLLPLPATDEATRANFERLDELVYGPQDYYLVLRRPVTAAEAPAEATSEAAAIR